MSTDILLEDPTTGQLFDGAPYTDAGVVEATLDSSRFFAVRVVGDGGRKAVLGIGFEERGEAIDFGITLQDVRKVQGIEVETGMKKGATGKKAAAMEVSKEITKEKKDFSLKAGETIHVDIGRKARKKVGDTIVKNDADKEGPLYSIAPPLETSKAGVGEEIPWLLPPPGGTGVKAERRRSRPEFPAGAGSASDLGFDDGEFGEFQ